MAIDTLFEIDAIYHLLVPLIIIRLLAIFYEIDKKLILITSIFALIPDIDFFFWWHRATLHNLFFGLILVILAILILKKYFNKKHIALLGGFFFLSHDILDHFMVAWLYPFIKYHFNPFTMKTTSLIAMNAAKPSITIEAALFGFIGLIIIYGLLIYEIYRENAKKSKK